MNWWMWVAVAVIGWVFVLPFALKWWEGKKESSSTIGQPVILSRK